MPYDKQKQFKYTPWEFLAKLDLLNWIRYAAIVKELTEKKPKSILEIGPGEGVIKNVMRDFVEKYDTMDVNSKLSPTYQIDIRELEEKVKGKYECTIAADILEHIPFEDLEKAFSNLHSYLQQNGFALITIPHRTWFVFEIDWLNSKGRLLRFPDWIRTTYQKLRSRKENPIDPDHQWEIGDGKHSVDDVEEKIKNAGFKIERREKLTYVDFWILKK